MYTYYDWHFVREMLILLAVCLFVVYAVLTGAWQDRKARRNTTRIAQQDPPLPVATKLVRILDGHSAETQPARWKEMPVPG
jgi:hypothetical protein